MIINASTKNACLPLCLIVNWLVAILILGLNQSAKAVDENEPGFIGPRNFLNAPTVQYANGWNGFVQSDLNRAFSVYNGQVTRFGSNQFVIGIPGYWNDAQGKTVMNHIIRGIKSNYDNVTIHSCGSGQLPEECLQLGSRRTDRVYQLLQNPENRLKIVTAANGRQILIRAPVGTYAGFNGELGGPVYTSDNLFRRFVLAPDGDVQVTPCTAADMDVIYPKGAIPKPASGKPSNGGMTTSMLGTGEMGDFLGNQTKINLRPVAGNVARGLVTSGTNAAIQYWAVTHPENPGAKYILEANEGSSAIRERVLTGKDGDGNPLSWFDWMMYSMGASSDAGIMGSW